MFTPGPGHFSRRSVLPKVGGGLGRDRKGSAFISLTLLCLTPGHSVLYPETDSHGVDPCHHSRFPLTSPPGLPSLTRARGPGLDVRQELRSHNP